MNQLLYIVWNPDLVAFRLGPLSVRWYGLMWSIGIVLAFLVVKRPYWTNKYIGEKKVIRKRGAKFAWFPLI